MKTDNAKLNEAIARVEQADKDLAEAKRVLEGAKKPKEWRPEGEYQLYLWPITDQIASFHNWEARDKASTLIARYAKLINFIVEVYPEYEVNGGYGHAVHEPVHAGEYKGGDGRDLLSPRVPWTVAEKVADALNSGYLKLD